MKQFYRISNKDMVDIEFCYGTEIEIVDRENRYTLVRLTDSQYEELIEAEVEVFRA